MKSSALLMIGLLLFSVFAVSTFSSRTGVCDTGKDYDVNPSETENESKWKFGRIQLNTTADGLVPLLETFTTVMESNTTDWDETGIGTPCVIYDSGLYKMWYGASSIPWVWPYIMGREVIAYAESNDGVTWVNKQVVHDSGAEQPAYFVTGSPYVIKEGGTYRMWHMDYYEYVAGDWSGYIAHMNSSDGVSWPAFMSADDQKVLSAQGQSTPQGDGYHISHVCVIHEPSEYVMWYAVADHPQPGVGGPSKIWRATSTDGIAWANRQLSLPYIPDTWEGSIWHSSVVKEDDGAYTMFYTAAYPNGSYASIGIAESIDGISWTNRTQLLKPSDLGANVTWLGTPFHFEDVDGKRYLYFTYYVAPPYDATIEAYCYTEEIDVSVSISMDGLPTGHNTPYTFTNLTGYHSFTVPDTDPSGHWFLGWNTGEVSTTITVNSGGTYTAYYRSPYNVTLKAHCNTEDTDVSVDIAMDGSPTGFTTPYTFADLMGIHTFTVPDNDTNGHSFRQWNTGETSTTITVTDGGTYTAYYDVMYNLTITTTTGGTTNPTPGTYTYWSGAVVNVTAIPDTGYALDHWELDSVNVGTNNPINVTMDTDHLLHAVFGIHDVAVIEVTSSKTVVGQGYSLNISVTVENQGDFNETFRVSAIYDELVIPTPEQWETFWSMGDVNGDGFIDQTDLYLIGAHICTGDPQYDIDEDGHVTPLDMVKCAVNLGENIWTHFGLGTPPIGTQWVVNLPNGTSTTITFTWNTTGFAKGNYTISAYAWPVLGENDTADNTFTNGVVTVAMAGDLNADGIVDIFDIVIVAADFGRPIDPPLPISNPNADITNDGIVDIFDIVVVAANFPT